MNIDNTNDSWVLIKSVFEPDKVLIIEILNYVDWKLIKFCYLANHLLMTVSIKTFTKLHILQVDTSN